MIDENLLDNLKDKYKTIDEPIDTYLKGLLYAKPINYWDYIEVDTLLSLQKPRTDFKDEMIFIMYHQVTELVLKMMVHELQQLVFENLSQEIWIDKINRLNRYTDMLITSFDVMKEGMNYDDYNTFRNTLTPASGFQSAQFRFIEIYCTPLVNLVNKRGQKNLPENPTVEDYFRNIYWIDAGLDRSTGKKSLTLKQFEAKYLDKFIEVAKRVKGKTLAEKVKQMETLSEPLIENLKKFDKLYNIEWPLVHLNTAQHYLDSKGENKEATGGSEWKKYLHPKYQQRKFFPELFTTDEILNWGCKEVEIL